ncbi:MAG: hypothetical protein HOO91_07080 [Bacteroidales bacterium]|nr:hypothetical protein [Bacteroidales bacterium]
MKIKNIILNILTLALTLLLNHRAYSIPLADEIYNKTTLIGENTKGSNPYFGVCYVVNIDVSDPAMTFNCDDTGTKTITVTTTNGCTNWGYETDCAWLLLTRNGSTLSVMAQNNTGIERIGHITFLGDEEYGNIVLKVTQKAPCPVPTVGPIYGTISPCAGSSGISYYVTPIAGVTSYTWTLPSGASIASGAGSSSITVNFSSSAASGNIYVKATNACGISPQVASLLYVTSIPQTPGAISGSTSLCIGNSAAYSISPVTGATTYNWSVTGGTITSSFGNGANITFPSTGTSTVSVTAGNGCGNSSASIRSVTVNALPTPTISGSASVCTGSTGNIYTTQTGMTAYSWTVTGGTVTAGGTATSNSVTITWGAAGTGHVKVNYTNASGCTATSQVDKSVTINALSTPTISGTANVCSGSAGNVYTTQTGMTAYSWAVTGGTITAGGTTTSNTVTITWGAAGTGHVKVNYTNANGCSAAAQTDMSVIINALPVPTISGSTSSCTGSTGNIYTTQAGMTNYSWTVTGGTITAGGNTTSSSVTITWGAAGTGHVKVNYTNASGCTATSQVDKSVTINALPTPTISGPTSACASSTGNTYTTQTSMTSYSWAVTGGTISAGGTTTSTSATVTWGAAGTGHVKVNYINASGCASTAQTDMSVTINSAPTIPTNGQPQSVQVAEGSTATFSITATGTGITYKWQIYTVSSGIWVDIANATGSSHSFTTTYSQNGNQYRCVVSGTCLPSVTSSSATLTVNSNPNKVSITYIPLIKDYAYNFVQEIQPQVKLQSSRLDSLLQGKIATLKVGDVTQSISYFDGLGRPIQTLGYRTSPSGNDIIQPIAYDNMGREKLKYLPYSGGYDGKFKPNALGSGGNYSTSDHLSFYQNTTQTDLPTAEPNPYSDAVFEPSPINRVLEQGAPGSTWQPTNQTGSSNGHTQRMVYSANGQYEVLQLTSDTTGLLTNSTGELSGSRRYYPANQLYKTIVKSENWQTTDGSLNTTEEFKDKQGQVILKRTFVKNSLNATVSVSTYYVYDDLNLLRYVIPPAAADIITFPANKDNSVVKNLCYYYRYDGRKRMIEKQLPGADPVYMVYDKRDRLVATQDGNMRLSGKWLITKYDELNRSVATAEFANSSSPDAMQTLANSYMGSNLFEVRDNSTLHGYTKRSFPGIVADDCYLTVTYYDDYLYKDQPSVSFDNSQKIDSYRLFESVKYNQAVLGQATGTKVKVLKDGAATWLRSAIYYDDRYRTIQTVRETYPSGLEYTSSRYSFNNSIAETKTYQSYGHVTMDNLYSYDHAWRPLKTVQTISKGSVTKVETLAEQEYNEIGQLKSKRLSGGAQQLDYAYNIRGWLTTINNIGSASSNVRQFSLSLRYNDSSMGVLPQFNGNISSISWRMPGGTGAVANGAQQNYSFTYDALNRLRNCHYSEGLAGNLTNEGNYDESIGNYDLNGNILSLSRKKVGVEKDALVYTYEGNRLVAVNDAADDNTLFTEKSQSGIEYTYDVNGNMITDLNKGISVAYNVLNLPKQVESGSDFASYIYDASGNKLAQMIRSGSARDTLYYSGAFIYNDAKLDYALTGEGRVVYANGLFSYEYFLKDHLGSTRVATAASGTVNTSTFYYPFGLALKEVNSQGDNRYLYNGKELQDISLGGVELGWVDYGARFYDPQIGRWMSIDPLAEKYISITPYNYVGNNPIVYFDPDGRIKVDSKGNVVFTPTGNPVEVSHPSGSTATVQQGYVYADDGTKIESFKNLTGDKGWDTDCHGVTFANGQVWINNDQVDKILNGDGYVAVNKSDTKEGDKVVYRDGEGNAEHSVTVVDKENGAITVEGQGGLETENHKDNVDKAWDKNSKQTYYRKQEKKKELKDIVKLPSTAAKDNTNVGSGGNAANGIGF